MQLFRPGSLLKAMHPMYPCYDVFPDSLVRVLVHRGHFVAYEDPLKTPAMIGLNSWISLKRCLWLVFLEDDKVRVRIVFIVVAF